METKEMLISGVSACIVFILGFCMGIMCGIDSGISTGKEQERKALHQSAIYSGVAQYNPTNGQFEWKNINK